MTTLPICKGERQGQYCVSFYCLGRQPINDLHGLYTVIGTYDRLEEAEQDAERIRLQLNSIGGRVKVHQTGYPERLLGDDAKYASDRKLVSSDEASLLSLKARAEAEKKRRERQEIERKRRELLEEEKLLDDPNSLEAYAKLQVSRRMLEESIFAEEQQLIARRQRLTELRAKIAEREQVHAEFSEQWRDFVAQQLGNKDVFILQERE